MQPQIPQSWGDRGQSGPAGCKWGSQPVSLSPCATVSRLKGKSPGSCSSQAIIILWQDQSLSSCELRYQSCCLVGQAGKVWGGSTDKMRVHRDSSSSQGSPPNQAKEGLTHYVLQDWLSAVIGKAAQDLLGTSQASPHPRSSSSSLKTCQPWQMAHLPMLMSQQDLIPASH